MPRLAARHHRVRQILSQAVLDDVNDIRTLTPDHRARQSDRRLNIWCAASSSGQEPYTIALVLKEYFPELAGWTLGFTATDISREMLRRSKQGRYSQIEVNRGLYMDERSMAKAERFGPIAGDLANSVQVGMTRPDVVKILGEPSGGMHISGGESDVEKMTYALDPQGEIIFRMEKGKVAQILR